jgi:hypothetical protein
MDLWTVVAWLCTLTPSVLGLNKTGEKWNSQYKIAQYYGSRDRGKYNISRVPIPRYY